MPRLSCNLILLLLFISNGLLSYDSFSSVDWRGSPHMPDRQAIYITVMTGLQLLVDNHMGPISAWPAETEMLNQGDINDNTTISWPKTAFVLCPPPTGGGHSGGRSTTTSSRTSERTYAEVVAGITSHSCSSGAGGDKPPNDGNGGDKRTPVDKPVFDEDFCIVCRESCRKYFKTSCCRQLVCPDCAEKWHETRCIACCRRQKPHCYCQVGDCGMELDSESLEAIFYHLILEHGNAIPICCMYCGELTRTCGILPLDHALTHHSHTNLIYANGLVVSFSHIPILVLAVPVPAPLELFFDPVSTEYPFENNNIPPLMQGMNIQYDCDLCLHTTGCAITHVIHMAWHMLHIYQHSVIYLCPHFPHCSFQTDGLFAICDHIYQCHLSFACPFVDCQATCRDQLSCQQHFDSHHGKYEHEVKAGCGPNL